MAERRPALPPLEARHTPALAEYRARQGLARLARPQKIPRPRRRHIRNRACPKS